MGSDLDELALEYMAKALCCMAGNPTGALVFDRTETGDVKRVQAWEAYTVEAQALINRVEEEYNAK